MSKVAITGNVSGTGTLTIAAPNTNTDYTLTLPTNTGTILTNATTTGFPAGSVLQVVQATTSTEVSTSSAAPTYVDTGLSASITPSSASSKILVCVNHGTVTKSSGNANNRLFIRIMRGSTEISLFGNGLNYTATALQVRSSASFAYLDSPATTSSTTYKTQFANGDPAAEVQVQTNSSMSSIILMEIAA
jgi:hypothetical protein